MTRSSTEQIRALAAAPFMHQNEKGQRNAGDRQDDRKDQYRSRHAARQRKCTECSLTQKWADSALLLGEWEIVEPRDRDKLVDDQTCPADQATVHVRLGHDLRRHCSP